MHFVFAKLTVFLNNSRFFNLNRKRLGLISFVFIGVAVVGIWLALGQTAAAEKEISDYVANAISYVLLWVATLFLKIAVFALKFVIELGSYNGYITAQAVSTGWVMVRDVANMFFVIILLLIAFGTILGIEQYEWKKLLVKLFLAAILVNFSRVICGVIIDAAQIVMVTFINGVVATAGGNLINAFNLDDIMKLSGSADSATIAEEGNVFMAAVGAIVFAGLAMATILIYMFILLARMLVLWVLIVLSPLAFVLSVIPQTQAYAKQWWTQFGGHVVVGPVLAFFLWLSFVTVGSGDIHKEIASNTSLPSGAGLTDENISSQTDLIGRSEMAGITKAMTWEKMANFAIAVGMLIVGAKAAQQTGAVGGGAMAGAIDFGKKVATIASGVAAGMWLYGGAKQEGGRALGTVAGLPWKGVKKAAWHFPVVGGEKIATIAKTEWDAIKGWYFGKGMMPTEKEEEVAQEIGALRGELGEEDQAKRAELEQRSNELAQDLASGDLTKQQMQEAKVELDGIKVQLGERDPAERARLRKELEAKGKEMEKAGQKDVFDRAMGWFARRGIRMEKRAAKTQRQYEVRRKILWKRTGSESGGYIFGMRKRSMRDAQDRMERGWLKVEEMRSAAKDDEGETQGMFEVLSRPRFKNGKFETDKGTMQERITQRKMKAEEWQAKIGDLEATAKLNLVLNPNKDAAMGAIDGTRFTYAQLEDAKAMTQLKNMQLSEAERGSMDRAMGEKERDANFLHQLAGLMESGMFDDEARRKAINEKQADLDDKEKKLDDIVQRRNSLLVQKGNATRRKTILEEEREEMGEAFSEEAKQELQELDEAIAELDTRLESASINRTALTQAQQSRQEAKKELKKVVGEEAEKRATSIRNGDTEVMEQFRDSLQKEAAALTKQGEGDLAKEKLDQAKLFAKGIQSAQSGGVVAWKAAVEAAKAKEINRDYRFRHNSILSDAEQLTIFNKRGIDTPNTALAELIEEYTRDFSDISYDNFVNSAHKTVASAVEEFKSKGKISDGRKASLIGLFKRGFDESWVDDIIISIMSNEKTRASIGEQLGWTNMDFTADRLGEVEMLFATGNLDFAKTSIVAREVGDIAEEMGVASDKVFEGFKSGNFVNAKGEKVDNAKIKEAVQKRFKKFGRVLTEEQKGMLDILTSEEGEEAARKQAKQITDQYIQAIRDNQPSLQFFGNLRNAAITNKHAENSEWTRHKNMGKGETVYMPVGTFAARDNAYGDVNKTDDKARRSAHPHMGMDLVVNAHGQVAMKLRKKEDAIVRRGITDARTHAGTTPRQVQMFCMVGSAENTADFIRRETGALGVGTSEGVKLAAKEHYGYAVDRMAREMAALQGKEVDQQIMDDAAKIIGAKEGMRNVWLEKADNNMADLLMTVGEGSNVSTHDASVQGKMNVDVPVMDKATGKVNWVKVRSAKDLVQHFRDGTFGFRKNLPEYEPAPGVDKNKQR